MSRQKDNLDEVDLSSPNFNAARALNEPKYVKIPCPSAPVYDNISCFEETPDGIFPKPRKFRKEKKQDEPKPNATALNTEQPSCSQLERKKDAQENIKMQKNVLTRMEQTTKGPLTLIKKCMDEKLRVKVYTRSAITVRGFCIGFVVAFDKHLNLVLRDVFETWTRKRKRKASIPATERSDSDSENHHSSSTAIKLDRRDQLGVKSRTIVRKRLKRKEVCERHVDQILIRGEQIVIVIKEPTDDIRTFLG